MELGLSDQLLINCGYLFVFGYLILSLILPSTLSFIIASLKTTFVLLYFTYFYNPFWNYQDSLVYRQEALNLMNRYQDPLNLIISIFSNPVDFNFVKANAVGVHILYGIYHFTADYLLGLNISSVAIFNVGVTFIGAFYFYKTLKLFQFNSNYTIWATLFYSLQWDNLAWSTIINLKEILTQVLVQAIFYYGLRFYLNKDKTALWGIFISSTLLMFNRFYIIGIIALCFAIAVFFEKKNFFKDIFIIGLVFFTFFLFTILGVGQFEGYLRYLNLSPFTFIGNGIRFWITPQVWILEPRDSFLFFPTLIHQILLIPSLLTLPHLLKQHPFIKFYFLFALILTLIYAGFPPEAVGARQRVQMLFLITLMQFHLFWISLHWLKSLFGNRDSRHE